MSDSDKLSIILSELQAARIKQSHPSAWFKYWLPTIIIVATILGGVWRTGRYALRAEESVKKTTIIVDKIQINQNVMIDFMEDSLGYDHDESLDEYEYRHQYRNYEKKGNTKRGVTVENVADN